MKFRSALRSLQKLTIAEDDLLRIFCRPLEISGSTRLRSTRTILVCRSTPVLGPDEIFAADLGRRVTGGVDMVLHRHARSSRNDVAHRTRRPDREVLRDRLGPRRGSRGDDAGGLPASTLPSEPLKSSSASWKSWFPWQDPINSRSGWSRADRKGRFLHAAGRHEAGSGDRSGGTDVVPDFEASRIATEDLPLTHVEEAGSGITDTGGTSSLQGVPAAGSTGPCQAPSSGRKRRRTHFPIVEMMSEIRNSERPHIINIEYEGWIPDIDPNLDCIEETRRSVQLIRRHLAA